MPPVTTDSFRDPRRLYAVRVLSGFFISGREPAKVGEVVNLPRTQAYEAVHSGKAEWVVETAAPPVAPPAVEPAPPITTPVKGTKKE